MIDVLAHPELGDILVGPSGLTLYIFDVDAPGVSNCSGGCAATWPPLEVAGELGVPAAVTATPGTIIRGDGATQGTLGGLPLYYFAGDSSPGDINGHGVSSVWWAVTPAGNAAGVLMGAPTGSPEESEPTEIPPTPTEEPDSGYDYGYG